MIPTPDLSHLTTHDYNRIYEPAEDTFLLLDALERDEQHLKRSGCVTSFVGKIFGSSVLYLCTDINEYACRCTIATGAQNKVSVDSINASFASPFMARLRHAVDVILFNPPYVPTDTKEISEAQEAHGIEGSWAGGASGMEVTDTFLKYVEELLSERGRFYLVAVRENNIPLMQEKMHRLYNLKGEIVLSRRAGREHLSVMRFIRTKVSRDRI